MGLGESELYLQVRVDEDHVPPLVTAVGELDAASAPLLTRAIDDALAAGAGVALELGDVSFIDSSGLRTITVALRRARAEEQPFEVIRRSEAVQRLFELTGIGSLLDS